VILFPGKKSQPQFSLQGLLSEMGLKQFQSDLFPIEFIDVPDSPRVLLKAYPKSRFHPFNRSFVLFLQLRMHIRKGLFKYDGLCFERADEGCVGMDGLNSMKFIIMQLAIRISNGDDLLVFQATLLLKANGKVFHHYLEYIL
jgi:hypothetical protein